MILLHAKKRIVNLSSLHVERPSSVGLCACIWFIIPWPEQFHRYKFASHHSVHVTRPSILWNIFIVKYSLTLGFQFSIVQWLWGCTSCLEPYFIHILGTKLSPSKVMIYVKMDWIETKCLELQLSTFFLRDSVVELMMLQWFNHFVIWKGTD